MSRDGRSRSCQGEGAWMCCRELQLNVVDRVVVVEGGVEEKVRCGRRTKKKKEMG